METAAQAGRSLRCGEADHSAAVKPGRGSPIAARPAVAGTFFAHGVFFASWVAHIPHVQSRLGVGYGELGTLLLAAPLGVLCAMSAATRLLPRLGSRRAVQVGAAGYCTAGPLVGLASSPASLFVTLFAWGAFQALLDGAMNTQGVAVERALDRRLMPGWHGGWSIGSFCGAGVGSAAVAAGVSLTPQLALEAVPLLAAILILSRRMVDDPPPVFAPAADSVSRGRYRPLLALAAVAFAGLLCEGAAADWAAVYLRRSLHAVPGIAGLGYTAFSLAMVTVRLAGNRLLTRWPSQRVLPALTAVATLGFGASLAFPGIVSALLGFTCLGLGLASVVPAMFSAAGRIPGLDGGAGIPAVAAVSYTGLLLGPPLIGALAGLGSLRSALLLLPLLTAFMTVVGPRAVGAPGELRPARRRR